MLNKELHRLHSSPNLIRTISLKNLKLAKHVALFEEKNIYRVLTGKPERKRPIGRTRHE
jgi:hypothetical protein